MTNAEVQEVTGNPGDYRVKVLKKARYVDVDACVACNACSDICPISVWSEFDSKLMHRKAIYIPFPQAVPNSYLVDPETCTYILTEGKKCGACLKKCPKDCIHLNEKDQIVEFEVGNIILATGYELFDAKRIERYGYGKFPNVLTSLEFERITNASGPTGGKIVLKTKKLNKRTKVEEWVADPEGAAAEKRGHHPLCRIPGCKLQLLLFAGLLHVLAQVCPPGPAKSFPMPPATNSTSTCAPSEKGTRNSWSGSRRREPISSGADGADRGSQWTDGGQRRGYAA